MILVLAEDSPLIIGGGVAGLLAFLVAIVRILSDSRTWRALIEEVRSELQDCRTERGALIERVKTLEGELATLRTQVHLDVWTGVDPASRAHFDE